MYVLHRKHGQLDGVQFFTRNLKVSKSGEVFNSKGIKSHIFGPRNVRDSDPYIIVLIFLGMKSEFVLLFVVLYLLKERR